MRAKAAQLLPVLDPKLPVDRMASGSCRMVSMLLKLVAQGCKTAMQTSRLVRSSWLPVASSGD